MAERSPRYRLRGLTVVYDTGESFWSGPVVNASASGMFIETTHQVAVGTRLSLLPAGHDDSRLPFEVTGVVVRVQDLDKDGVWARTPGIAFQLDGMSDEAAAKLAAFLCDHGEKV
jgi:hypothetical protein